MNTKTQSANQSSNGANRAGTPATSGNSAAKPALNDSAAASIVHLSATELVRQIAGGTLSAAEVVEAHIAQIEQVNPKLNAIVVKRYEATRNEARTADARRKAGKPLGALHGLPVTIKESLDLEGTASTFGLPSHANQRASKDEKHVARLHDAGAIVLGKSNVAQLLLFYESDNPVYGSAKNPWNLNRTPGGSSGGEAAIIAAGGSPLGLGTDIGGSVRIPATFSGIASIKPTAGRTPDMGRFSVPVGQQAIPSQVGVMARQVEDVALGLQVINGGCEAALPLGDFRKVDLSKLRVAYYSDDGTFSPTHGVVRAVRESVEMMRSLGAQVTAWKPPLADHALDLVYGIFVSDGGKLMNGLLGKGMRSAQLKEMIMGAGLPHWAIQTMMKLLNSTGQHGKAAGIRAFGHSDTAHYWRLAEQVLDYQERFQEALDHDAGGPFDLILAPVSPLPAYTHGSSATLLTAGAYACLYNVLGYPAGVVPVTRVRVDEEIGRKPSKDSVEAVALAVEEKSAGLPIGVQVVARPWRDHVALAAMHAIEQIAKGRADYPQTPVVL